MGKYLLNQTAVDNLRLDAEDVAVLEHMLDFESAREAHRKKEHSRHDKRMSLPEAIKEYVKDGDIITANAFNYVRTSLQADCEIMRQGIKNLCSIGSPNVVQSLLLHGKHASRVHVSYTGAEMRGIDRHFDRKFKEGTAKVLGEWSHGVMAQGFKAAHLGCPGLFSKQMLASDMVNYNPVVKVMQNPMKDEEDPVLFVPALYPDVSVIHVQWADKYGNARIFGPAVNDIAVAAATRKLIITAEEIVPEMDIRNNNKGVVIPFMYVDAVVELPYGGLPGSVPGYYYWPREWWEWMIRIAFLDDEKMTSFMDYWVYGTKDQYDFIEKLGGAKWLAQARRLTKAAEGDNEIDGVDFSYTEVYPKFE